MKKFGRLFVSIFLIGACAPAFAQQVVDSWAPAGAQPPIALQVNDPVRGLVPFPRCTARSCPMAA